LGVGVGEQAARLGAAVGGLEVADPYGVGLDGLVQQALELPAQRRRAPELEHHRHGRSRARCLGGAVQQLAQARVLGPHLLAQQAQADLARLGRKQLARRGARAVGRADQRLWHESHAA